MIEFHDAFNLGCVERVNKNLSLRKLQLRFAVGEGGGDGRRVSQLFIQTKSVDCATLAVLSDVVIRELTGCSKE